MGYNMNLIYCVRVFIFMYICYKCMNAYVYVYVNNMYMLR